MALTQIQQAMLADGILTADAAGRLKMADGFVNTAKLLDGLLSADAGGRAKMADAFITRQKMGYAGAILQVAQAVKTDAFSTASTTMIDISGLSVSITPTASTSKFLIMVDVMISAGSYVSLLNLVRNSTNLFQGDAAGSRPTCSITFGQDPSGNGISQRSSITYLDSPATASAITYKVQGSGRPDGGASGSLYINRTVQDRDTNTYDQRGASSITVLEIVG